MIFAPRLVQKNYFPKLSLTCPQPIHYLHNISTAKTSFQLARTVTAHADSFEQTLSAPVIPQNTQFLDWFPFYVHRFIGDARYRKLADYQQAWYWNLLFESWVSERPGYLPDDGQLWRLANARTRQFFEKECEPILCMFEREGSTTDDEVWIYHRMLLEIYDEQVLKFHKRKRKSSKSTIDNGTSYLDFEGTLGKKENGREECSRHPQSGLTQWGSCWERYAEKCSSQAG